MNSRYLIASALAFTAPIALATDSLEWRGKDGQGHAEGVGYPQTWSDKENVLWNTPLPGRGWSSPVVLGNQIWMTTALEVPLDPAKEAERLKTNTSDQPLTVLGEVQLQALCVDKVTGKLLHQIQLHTEKDPQWVHKLNSYASCSPAAEPGRLYCHFGTFGTFCVDTAAGQLLWKNTDAALKLMHENGPGSSVILWEDKVIFHGDGSDVQFVAALDKGTGKLAWKTARSGEMNANPQLKKSYATPQVIMMGSKPVLFSQGANWLYGYEPATGKELWKVSYGGLGFSLSARAVTGHGMMFLSTGFMKPQMLAIKYQDMNVPEIAWSFTKSAPTMPSPLLVGDELYFLSDGGILVCVDAKTGKEHYRERLSESAASKKLGGTYSASPMVADGRLYIFNREGTTHVVKPGTTYQKVADNVIGAQIMATPAAVDRVIYLRTDKGMMALGVR